MQQYIDESCFLWNTRRLSEGDRFEIMFNKSIGLVVRWEDPEVVCMKKGNHHVIP